ncbi:ABC transporter substrate-binding protein [Salipiger sp. PrR002]|uniref:ABC transporter substrate-binding protein n=1 Tax=Salipiger sp. PrR002 TaxID=2706489 RepID=UPI0013BD7735|nr:ABC transporter substrate-binding protein [Salipiger sp. PrR002]NDV98780.1 ABC transporter substrate-binding protein [Salipiger sp. PrR002]NDW55517.1 ABC transporter substrate-binding protein [Salipiger sp. PrR004]
MFTKFPPALLAVGLSLLSTTALAEPFRIIVTSTEAPLVPNSVMFLAESAGYFDAQGVDVELVPAAQTPMAVAALRSGGGEMANISVESLLALHAEGGDDLVAVHSTDKSIPFMIVGRKGLTVDTLSGADYGVGRMHSLDYDLSGIVIENLGVNFDTLNVVPLGAPSVRAQALGAGRIDATTVSIGTFLSMPGHEDFDTLVDVGEFFRQVPIVSKVDVVPEAVLAERGEDLQKVLTALTLAARDYAATPEKWVEDMAAARPDVDRETLEALAETYHDSWTVNGGLQVDELFYAMRSLGQPYKRKDGEDLPFRVELEDWTAFGPMDAVLEQEGVSDLADPVSR